MLYRWPRQHKRLNKRSELKAPDSKMEMETDGPDEDQLLMLSKAPSMTMLNEREVSHK